MSESPQELSGWADSMLELAGDTDTAFSDAERTVYALRAITYELRALRAALSINPMEREGQAA